MDYTTKICPFLPYNGDWLQFSEKFIDLSGKSANDRRCPHGSTKKPTYGFVASRGEYRMRIKGPDERRISIYAKTPEELTEKIAAVQRKMLV